MSETFKATYRIEATNPRDEDTVIIWSNELDEDGERVELDSFPVPASEDRQPYLDALTENGWREVGTTQPGGEAVVARA